MFDKKLSSLKDFLTYEISASLKRENKDMGKEDRKPVQKNTEVS